MDKTLSIDDILNTPCYRIRPAMWWITQPDAATQESRLASWAKGRDFQIVKDNGGGEPYLSINSTIGKPDVFVDAASGFAYPNAQAGSKEIYFTPPRKKQ